MTGDKEETAVNISHSAQHFSQDMIMLKITQMKSSLECAELIRKLTLQSVPVCVLNSSAYVWGFKTHVYFIRGSVVICPNGTRNINYYVIKCFVGNIDI